MIYSPCLFASVDPIFNGSRLNPGGKELDQGRLETEHDCVQSGQPALRLKDWSMRCDRPDVAVDEEHDPEADVASLCPVELLQRQKREKSRS